MSGGLAVPSSSDLLALATAAAREAGELVAGMRAGGVDVAATKSSVADVVTLADRASEELIRDRLLGPRPGDGFVGEEGEDVPSSSGVRWIVDPIDGTVNYLYGRPEYAVSIAAEVAGVVVAGVVLGPATGLEYAATLGGGATRNGVPVQVGDTPPLDQTLVATGFSYEAAVRARQGKSVARMLPQVRDIRRNGSCALDLCAVASGECDGYVEEGPHLWDYAAGGLVAREAGAVLEVWPAPLVNPSARLLVCAPAAGWETFLTLVGACGFPVGEPDPQPSGDPTVV